MPPFDVVNWIGPPPAPVLPSTRVFDFAAVWFISNSFVIDEFEVDAFRSTFTPAGSRKVIPELLVSNSKACP